MKILFVHQNFPGQFLHLGPELVRRGHACLALTDAGLDYSLVQQVYAGYVYGDTTSGQRAVYEVGMSGVPVFNVNNNCSTGSTALMLAYVATARGDEVGGGAAGRWVAAAGGGGGGDGVDAQLVCDALQ